MSVIAIPSHSIAFSVPYPIVRLEHRCDDPSVLWVLCKKETGVEEWVKVIGTGSRWLLDDAWSESRATLDANEHGGKG